jgi:rare lipoprotein A
MAQAVLLLFAILFAVASLFGCASRGHDTQPIVPAPQAQASPVTPEAVPQVQTPAEPLKQWSTGELSAPDRETPASGRPYRVKGKIYYPMLTTHGFEERGLASWYGPSCHGSKTTSGEVFDMYKISAAHKLLPMNSKVKVTNIENGKSIVLRVNDRGPFVAGRVIDLSYGAAKKLDIVDRGCARVLVKTEGRVVGQKKHDLSGAFFVHVGAFELRSGSAGLIADMKTLGYRTSHIAIVKSDRESEPLWRVQIGPYPSMAAAQRTYAKVVRDYPSAFVVAQ